MSGGGFGDFGDMFNTLSISSANNTYDYAILQQQMADWRPAPALMDMLLGKPVLPAPVQATPETERAWLRRRVAEITALAPSVR